MEEVRVKFFDIHKCGFYHRGQGEPVISNTDDCLEKLKSWAQDGRTVENTTTYEEDIDNDIRNTYFVDAVKNSATGDYILTLWNEVANDNGVIYGMNPNQSPGNTDIMQTGFGDAPAIPGFPSYFWFLPSEGLFATIKFDHSVQGKNNLDLFLNGYLANKSPYRVVDSDDLVIGFSTTGNQTENHEKIYSKFHATGKKSNEIEVSTQKLLH